MIPLITNFSLLVLFLKLEPGFACDCGKENIESRIVNGKEAVPNIYPWMIGLFGLEGWESVYCGGAIISDLFVLTAAHCVTQIPIENITVAAGVHNINFIPYTRKVKRIIVHENYSTPHYLNDLALIQLDASLPMEDPRVGAICLADSTIDTPDTPLLAAGWGYLNYYSKETPETLFEVELARLDLKHCQRRYGRVKITSNHICTEAPGKDACKGDSGGPLMIRVYGVYYITGVVSWGIGCANQRNPGVYAKITSYIDWIHENIEKTSSVLCTPEKDYDLI